MIEAIIIDFNFSNLHESTIQELAYVNTATGESMCYYIHDQFAEKKLINDSNNIHTVFNYLAKSSDVIFLVKGEKKVDFLTTLTGREFHNLERYSCPDIKRLPYPQIYCGYHNNINCVLKMAKAYANWYNE